MTETKRDWTTFQREMVEWQRWAHEQNLRYTARVINAVQVSSGWEKAGDVLAAAKHVKEHLE